jgi:hypothetical protein
MRIVKQGVSRTIFAQMDEIVPTQELPRSVQVQPSFYPTRSELPVCQRDPSWYADDGENIIFLEREDGQPTSREDVVEWLGRNGYQLSPEKGNALINGLFCDVDVFERP